MLYSPLTVGKKKRKQGIINKNQNIPQVVVCPNCSFHFKVIFQGTNHKADIQVDHNLKQFQGKEISARNSPLRKKDLSAEEITEEFERILINSVNSKGISKLEKLKNLNDLNQLKRSRFSENERIEVVSFKDIQLNEESNSRSQLGYEDPSPTIENKKQASLINTLQNHQEREPQKSRTNSQELSPRTRQKWIQELQIHEKRKLLLSSLLNWIYNSGLSQRLPSYLKMLLDDEEDNSDL